MTDTEWAHLIGLMGPLSVAILFGLMGRLSKKLGTVTQAAPYYHLFYIASALTIMSLGARLWNIIRGVRIDLSVDDHILWVLLYNGLPALGVTLGIVAAWRYWSWLLAERS
jgi:hypothetical protein